MKHSLREYEAARCAVKHSRIASQFSLAWSEAHLTSPWAEGSLHRAKPCFIFHAPQVRFISKQKSTALAVLFCLEACWQKRCRLLFYFAKTLSSAIRTFCDARIVKMDRNIYLIPFRLEFSFTFWTNVCFWYYNDVQDDKQDKYRNSYKIPWYIEMTTEPINLTGR